GCRHRDAGNLHVDRAEVVAAGEVQGRPVVAAKRHVGGGGSPVNDAAELFAIRIHDPYPARSATIDIAFDVHFHAVGNPGLVAAQVDKDAVGLFGRGAVGQQVERPNVPAARVVDVEDLFIGRERESSATQSRR